MKLGIVGSRNFTDKRLMVGVLADFMMWNDAEIGSDEFGRQFWSSFELVSGGAKGADKMAAAIYRDAHLPVTEHLPAEKTARAYFARNSLIVRDADILMAFFGPGEPPSVNKSGTMDTVRKAIEKRIPVHLYFQKEDEDV